MLVCRIFLSPIYKISTSACRIRKMQSYSLYLRNTKMHMQQFIASYLFQNKTCPLPGLGTLFMGQSAAEADFSNKLMGQPKPFIHFENEEIDSDNFLDYVARSTETDKQEVTNTFNQFCETLKRNLSDSESIVIEQVGKLSVDAQGKINFDQEELPPGFIHAVVAERVFHPQAEHQMLVGDKETTNTVMTEFLAPKEAIIDRWWTWAIVLGAIGLGLLIIHFSSTASVSMFGNTTKF